MTARLTRRLAACHAVSDALLGMAAFGLAYAVRFEAGLIAAPKGQPPFGQYLVLIPFIGLLVPLAFHLQGAYRLRRIRTRVDDFFAVLVGNVVVVVVGLLGTLYFQVYVASPAERAAGTYEVSRIVWMLYLLLGVGLTFATREAARRVIQRRFRAGLGLKRVLIAGAGELARHVADKILQHGEFGYRVIGLVDDSAGGDTTGYRGLPLLGQIADAGEIIRRERIDQLYIALPLDEHARMIELIETADRECIDVKVAPDLLHAITLRARLEDLDGVPIININDVPLQGLSGLVKRAIDVAVAAAPPWPSCWSRSP